MKILLLAAAASAWQSHIDRMLDTKQPAAVRNDACYALRAAHSREVVAAMEQALRQPSVRSCAATQLREAGASGSLRAALKDDQPEVRAAAASELGAMERREDLSALAEAAADKNEIVAASAVNGLAQFRDPAAVPYLIEVARRGGMAGVLAAQRAARFSDRRLLPVVRGMLTSSDVPVQLAAVNILGQIGEAADLLLLEPLKGQNEDLIPTAGRGLGLMPPINVARAARTAMDQIRSRSSQ